MRWRKNWQHRWETQCERLFRAVNSCCPNENLIEPLDQVCTNSNSHHSEFPRPCEQAINRTWHNGFVGGVRAWCSTETFIVACLGDLSWSGSGRGDVFYCKLTRPSHRVINCCFLSIPMFTLFLSRPMYWTPFLQAVQVGYSLTYTTLRVWRCPEQLHAVITHHLVV